MVTISMRDGEIFSLDSSAVSVFVFILVDFDKYRICRQLTSQIASDSTDEHGYKIMPIYDDLGMRIILQLMAGSS